MKRVLFITVILVMFFLSERAIAQNTVDVFRRTTAEMVLKECNYNGVTDGKEDKTIPVGSKFTIQNKKEGGYVIKFWNWSINKEEKKDITEHLKTNKAIAINLDEASPNLKNYLDFNIDEEGEYRYFFIPDWQFDNLTAVVENRLDPIYGITTIPFKIRSGFDVTKDVALGAAIGVKWRAMPTSDFSVNGLLGIAYSNVTLDSLNTNGTLTESTDRAAFTPYGGVVLDWKKVQIGFFTGADFLSKKDKNNWQSHGKLWFGIGLGFSIFDHNAPTKEGSN